MWRWCRSLAACSTSTTVASYLTYGDDSAGAGAFGDGGQMVGMTLAGSVYTTSYTYDDDARLTDMQSKRTSENLLFFESGRTCDAAGNVAMVWP